MKINTAHVGSRKETQKHEKKLNEKKKNLNFISLKWVKRGTLDIRVNSLKMRE